MLLSPNNRSFFLRVTSTESVGSENPLGVMFAVGNNCDQLVAFRSEGGFYTHSDLSTPRRLACHANPQHGIFCYGEPCSFSQILLLMIYLNEPWGKVPSVVRVLLTNMTFLRRVLELVR